MTRPGHAEYMREYRRRKLEQARATGVPEGVKHGAYVYKLYRCPCEVCHADHARNERERRQRRRIERMRAFFAERQRRALAG